MRRSVGLGVLVVWWVLLYRDRRASVRYLQEMRDQALRDLAAAGIEPYPSI